MDAATAMRLAEPEVAKGNAFLCIIEEVRPRISVDGLETIYQSTGRHWIARRTRSRSVFWEARRRTVDPAEIYRLGAPLPWAAGALALSAGRAGHPPGARAR